MELENFEEFASVVGLLVLWPLFNESEGVGESLKAATSDAVPDVLLHFLVPVKGVFGLLQLLKAKVQEHLKGQLKHISLLFSGESQVEI